MKEKLKILIANDDGIRSEGIAKLARAAASFGTVWVGMHRNTSAAACLSA